MHSPAKKNFTSLPAFCYYDNNRESERSFPRPECPPGAGQAKSTRTRSGRNRLLPVVLRCPSQPRQVSLLFPVGVSFFFPRGSFQEHRTFLIIALILHASILTCCAEPCTFTSCFPDPHPRAYGLPRDKQQSAWQPDGDTARAESPCSCS